MSSDATSGGFGAARKHRAGLSLAEPSHQIRQITLWRVGDQDPVVVCAGHFQDEDGIRIVSHGRMMTRNAVNVGASPASHRGYDRTVFLAVGCRANGLGR